MDVAIVQLAHATVGVNRRDDKQQNRREQQNRIEARQTYLFEWCETKSKCQRGS